jgi:hypothetical protein
VGNDAFSAKIWLFEIETDETHTEALAKVEVFYYP